MTVAIDPASGDETLADGAALAPDPRPDRPLRRGLGRHGPHRRGRPRDGPGDRWAAAHPLADDGAPAATGTPIAGERQEIGDFDVRWDESGEWVAVWTATPTRSDASAG